MSSAFAVWIRVATEVGCALAPGAPIEPVVLQIHSPEDQTSEVLHPSGRVSYRVQLGYGEPKDAELDWSMLEPLLRKVEADAANAFDIQELGRLLADFVGNTDVLAALQRADAQAVAGATVVVEVRAKPLALFRLPWDVLLLPGSDQPIGARPGFRLVLLGTGAPAPGPAPDGGPGSLLLAWSEAGGDVRAADHAQHLDAADRRTVTLPGASLGRLAKRLEDLHAEKRPARCLHLLCHGTADVDGPALLLEDDDGRPVQVRPNELANVLAHALPHLRLVVLSACHAGAPGPLGTFAERLHRAGIATALEFSSLVQKNASVDLAEGLYPALLATRRPALDAAFAARHKLLTRAPTGNEWAALRVFHHRGDDGPLLPPPQVKQGTGNGNGSGNGNGNGNGTTQKSSIVPIIALPLILLAIGALVAIMYYQNQSSTAPTDAPSSPAPVPHPVGDPRGASPGSPTDGSP